jgi:hypothetical protein
MRCEFLFTYISMISFLLCYVLILKYMEDKARSSTRIAHMFML